MNESKGFILYIIAIAGAVALLLAALAGCERENTDAERTLTSAWQCGQIDALREQLAEEGLPVPPEDEDCRDFRLMAEATMDRAMRNLGLDAPVIEDGGPCIEGGTLMPGDSCVIEVPIEPDRAWPLPPVKPAADIWIPPGEPI